MPEAGHPKLVLWDILEEWEHPRRGTHMHLWTYGKIQHNAVIILQLNHFLKSPNKRKGMLYLWIE